MRTVLVANRKGGVGKTMIAVTLSAALAGRGHRVALADADRQQSALAWLARRPQGVPQIRGLDWSTPAEIGEAPKRLDWLVIDAPGALKGGRAEALIAEAKAVLTPVQPSVFDETSTRTFLDEIEELKRIRKGKAELSVVANRIRPRSRAAAALTAFLADLGHEALAEIAERAAYGDLATDGLSIFDRQQAAMRALQSQWQPILDKLGA